ncbi:MAG: hypothetical protein VW543_17235, partial [Deltaproteobacteria bacterium]
TLLKQPHQYLRSPVHTAWIHFKSLFPLINDSSASVAVSAMKTSQLLLENAAYFVPMDLWVVSQVVIHQRLNFLSFCTSETKFCTL